MEPFGRYGEDEWDVRGYVCSEKEAEAVVLIIEEASGRKVRFRRSS